jgi:Flp pilus assembly protein TadD
MIGRHRALVLDGKRSEADAEVDKWLANNPKEIPTRAYLAEQGLQNQQFAKAAGYYETLTRLQPNNPLLLNNLAYCYQQLKSPKARETAEAALKLAPNNAAIMDTLAMIYVDSSDFSKALELLKRAVDTDKNNLEIRFHYAQILLKANRKPEAVKELEFIKSTGRTFSAENEMLELLKKLK